MLSGSPDEQCGFSKHNGSYSSLAVRGPLGACVSIYSVHNLVGGSLVLSNGRMLRRRWKMDKATYGSISGFSDRYRCNMFAYVLLSFSSKFADYFW